MKSKHVKLLVVLVLILAAGSWASITPTGESYGDWLRSKGIPIPLDPSSSYTGPLVYINGFDIIPTTLEGQRRYPPGGVYKGEVPCYCLTTCPYPCTDLSCPCPACGVVYHGRVGGLWRKRWRGYR